MTREQIEAAMLRLQRVAALAVHAEEAKLAFDDIDALCAAASGRSGRAEALERLLLTARKFRELYDWEDEAACSGPSAGQAIRDFTTALDDLEGK